MPGLPLAQYGPAPQPAPAFAWTSFCYSSPNSLHQSPVLDKDFSACVIQIT